MTGCISLLARSTGLGIEADVGGYRVGRGEGSEGMVDVGSSLEGTVDAMPIAGESTEGAASFLSLSSSEELISDSSLSSQYVMLPAARCEARTGS